MSPAITIFIMQMLFAGPADIDWTSFCAVHGPNSEESWKIWAYIAESHRNGEIFDRIQHRNGRTVVHTAIYPHSLVWLETYWAACECRNERSVYCFPTTDPPPNDALLLTKTH